jgi:hypothetical protein
MVRLCFYIIFWIEGGFKLIIVFHRLMESVELNENEEKEIVKILVYQFLKGYDETDSVYDDINISF